MSLMDLYGVQTEAEMVSGFFSELHPVIGNYSKMNSDPRKVEDKVREAMIALQLEAKNWYNNMVKEARFPTTNAKYAIASSWYHVTYHPDFLKCHGSCRNDEEETLFLSFPWVLYDKLLDIKRNVSLKKSKLTSNGIFTPSSLMTDC